MRRIIMIYTVANKFLTITTNTLGGEITSIKNEKNNKEYIWQGDSWPRHAPILFPVIGKLFEDKYILDGSTYRIPIHGGSRDREFEMTEKTENSITFTITHDDETLKVYPFKFSLEIKYTLIENNIDVKYIVNNINDLDMPFSIGSHEAYNCPLNDNELYDDYYLEFSENETIEQLLVNEDVFLTSERKAFLTNERKIPLRKDMFSNGVIILDGIRSNTISLKNTKNDNVVQVDITGFPYLGIWAQLNQDFICIEPWYGHMDYLGFTGDFKEKAGIIKLQAGKCFECIHKISIS
jgi:galactose mutarotase-like enzyme